MKKIVILGATGSIGQSTLTLVERNPEAFQIVGASAHSRFSELEAIAQKFQIPNLLNTKSAFTNHQIEAFLKQCEADIVLNAITGFAGLKFTIATLKLGIPLALANKESLVAAGDLIIPLAKEKNTPIIPVDSEHSAIFQCLVNDDGNLKAYEKIFLTCSGGPFFGWKDLSKVTLEQALEHPNWDMGAKITVDSATLANKCLEFFEAMYLFGARKDQIEIVIHRESIIHSLVEFPDSSLLAQMSPPSMELPIGYALNFPERHHIQLPKLDFNGLQLNFAKPDKNVFRTLQVLDHCTEHMGPLPLVFNAANEEARKAFIEGKITFQRIFEIIEETVSMASTKGIKTSDSIEKIYEADKDARKQAQSLI